MIYFTTRQKARNFAKGQKKIIDAGTGWGKLRWAVQVVRGAA